MTVEMDKIISDAARLTNAECRLAAKQFTPVKEFVSYFLPENCQNRDRVLNTIIHLHQLGLPQEASWYIGADTFIPFLACVKTLNSQMTDEEVKSYDAKSNSAHLLRRLGNAPTITWYTPDPHFMSDNIKTNIIRSLTSPTGNQKPFAKEMLLPAKGKNLKQKIFRITESEKGQAPEYIIVDESESLLHDNTTSVSYAVETPSGIKAIFTLNLKYAVSSDPQGRWTSWDNDEGKRFQFIDGIPYIAISPDSQKNLTSLMHMGKDPYYQGYGINVDWAYLRFENLQKSCKAWSREEESGESHYFVELAKKAAEMTYLAVSGERLLGKPAIDPEVAEQFKKEFSYLSKRFDTNSRYSPIEMAIAEVLWNGKSKIWDQIHEFTYYMTKAAAIDTGSFIRYLRSLGIDQVLPFFRKKTRDEVQIPDNLIAVAANIFNLAPNLSKHYDHRSGYEYKQSDTYFMKLALAMGHNAYEFKTEPIACIIVCDGEIIGAANNEPTDDPDIYIHAEILAIKRAKEKLKKTGRSARKLKLYSTAEPCPECATVIRRNPFNKVCIAIRTKMGGETLSHLLTSSALTQQGAPFYRPPQIVWDLHRKEAQQLLTSRMGWNNFVVT